MAVLVSFQLQDTAVAGEGGGSGGWRGGGGRWGLVSFPSALALP